MATPTTEAGLTPCFSCLQPRIDDELGWCLECGTCQCRIGDIGDCTGVCLCSLMREEDTDE
jgi:hypothetical protein